LKETLAELALLFMSDHKPSHLLNETLAELALLFISDDKLIHVLSSAAVYVADAPPNCVSAKSVIWHPLVSMYMLLILSLADAGSNTGHCWSP